jgi:hypothetical protein
MARKTAGLLIGIGAGLALAWAFRDRLRGLSDRIADIIVENGSGGAPRVTFVTPEVTVKRHKHVRWFVTNRSSQSVDISLRDWQDSTHRPVAPAVDADPDDREHPPQNGLSRPVPSGRRLPIRGRARGPQHGFEERVKYAVYLGETVAVDPIVKLVL